MKMVAAARLKRAQERILSARPYAYHIDEMIRHLVSHVEEIKDPLLEYRPAQRVLLAVITSDRGLCGSFNSNIIKKALYQMEVHKEKEVSLICVGRKGQNFFKKRDYIIEQNYLQIFNQLEYHHAQTLTDFIVKQYVDKKTDMVEIIYNEFKSAIQQNVIVEKYLPLTTKAFESNKGDVDYIYEPDKQSLLNALLPKHLTIQSWRVLLESNAAEQGARMTAMENATDNATDLIAELTLHYNKARQTSITKEISEIVGGAEALSAS